MRSMEDNKEPEIKLHPFVQKIYDALKRASYGQPQMPIAMGISAISCETAMPESLSQMWLKTLNKRGLISMDGLTIWLVKDFGPRQYVMSDEEKAILDAQKVPPKGAAAFRKKAEKLRRS